jgi:hypothetical protein
MAVFLRAPEINVNIYKILATVVACQYILRELLK